MRRCAFLLRVQLDLEADSELVGEASDGMEAVALPEEQDPDLLALDLMMPNLDGVQILERVRRVRELQALEINDDIVQNLTVAQMAFALEQPERGQAAVEKALDSANEH